MSNKIPVTVLTGFLGSGKTTLLNRILSEDHGLRIAVIENEFGEIGIDQDLVITANEEIMEMNNGCICCSVRGDLIRILGQLSEREVGFDRIIIETTGMADPGPVAQTFFVDKAVSERYVLDGIITLIDAKHVQRHLDDHTDEVLAQIAFADRLVLNKLDLVEEDALAGLTRQLKGINPMAELCLAKMADTPIAPLLDIGGFDLKRAVEMKPNFLEPEYPFEWAGTWSLASGRYSLQLSNGPDPDMALLMTPIETVSEEALLGLAENVFVEFSKKSLPLKSGEMLGSFQQCHTLLLNGDQSYRFPFDVAAPATIACVSQHTPEEFDMKLLDETGKPLPPEAQHFFNAEHTHNNLISSVSVELPGFVDIAKISAWFDAFRMIKGVDIFRMKGVLAVAGLPHRVLFQGVHMTFDNKPGKSWGDEAPVSRLVFIGIDLDEQFIRRSIADCLV